MFPVESELTIYIGVKLICYEVNYPEDSPSVDEKVSSHAHPVFPAPVNSIFIYADVGE